LAPYPDGLVIATKGGLTRPRSGEWRRDAGGQLICEPHASRASNACAPTGLICTSYIVPTLACRSKTP
jgi:hypothetical protein